MDKSQQEFLDKVSNYVKIKLLNEPTGRDWYHVDRVRRMSRVLQAEEGGNLFLIELAGLLHDVGDYKKHGLNELKGNLVLDAIMDILEIDNEIQTMVMRIVSESQYNGIETKSPGSIEGKIIQDADWLECIGAIGIARSFAIGNDFGRPIYDPNRQPRPVLNRIDYQKKKFEGTSFNYFYEKSLKLPAMMNTKTGKRIAIARAKFLEEYIKQFLKEWNLEDFTEQ